MGEKLHNDAAGIPMDLDSIQPSAPDQLSGGRTRKASPRPLALPKAPMSQEVAQRMIRNSTVRPVQRFDSADYFLQQHLERVKGASSTASSADLELASDTTVDQLEETLRGLKDAPQPPPPLSRDDATGSTSPVDIENRQP